MKGRACNHGSGSLLLETVLALAVVAVMVPVAMMAIGKACDSGLETRIETLGLWTVPACLDEWRAAGEPAALALASDGSVLGWLDAPDFDRGMVELEGRRVACLCGIADLAGAQDESGLRRLRIRLEYPAAAASSQLRRMEFHTLTRW